MLRDNQHATNRGYEAAAWVLQAAELGEARQGNYYVGAEALYSGGSSVVRWLHAQCLGHCTTRRCKLELMGVDEGSRRGVDRGRRR